MPNQGPPRQMNQGPMPPMNQGPMPPMNQGPMPPMNQGPIPPMNQGPIPPMNQGQMPPMNQQRMNQGPVPPMNQGPMGPPPPQQMQVRVMSSYMILLIMPPHTIFSFVCQGPPPAPSMRGPPPGGMPVSLLLAVMNFIAFRIPCYFSSFFSPFAGSTHAATTYAKPRI
jgi:hypothetical protein